MPYIAKHDKLVLDLYFYNGKSFKGEASVRCFKYTTNNDSDLVFSRKRLQVKCSAGMKKVKINFTCTDTNTFYQAGFYEAFKRTGNIVPGIYRIYLSAKDSSTSFHTFYYHEIDSSLSATSSLRRAINVSLAPSDVRLLLSNPRKNKAANATMVLEKKKVKIDKVVKRRGLRMAQCDIGDKVQLNFYYEDCFAGRYEVNARQPLLNQVREQEEKFKSISTARLLKNDMDHTSLFSQSKTIRKDKSEQQCVEGRLALTTNIATGQEENSGVSNNYQEISGQVVMPVMGLPVVVEGLYTTQDINRKIKSSYLRVHYDINKLKEETMESINAYNTKYAQTQSKSIGMEQLYQSLISALEAQKNKLLRELNSKGTSDLNITDTAESSLAAKGGDKQKEIGELDKKIVKYKTLLKQNENIKYFDSAVVYSKTVDILTKDLSVKQMAKRSSDLFPDGTSKKISSGLTSFDAGIFSKSASRYTMAGQQVKGMDVSYDLGFCEATGTVGKTEYIGREGTLDQFTCYSAETKFRPIDGHKLGVIYYGYSADRTLYNKDIFFQKVNITTPVFLQPVHIVATSYEGSISEYLKLDGEVAASFRKADKDAGLTDVHQKEKTAYHLEAIGTVPGTMIKLEGSYEKTGKHFENSTLPLAMCGTEHYRAGIKNDFFKSLVTIGIDYNRLNQSNFSSNGSNVKWGFELKTNSKRYPALSISYKPFTTFRSYTDTLTVPQRLLLGSVFNGKLTYKIKRKGNVLRFSLLCNESVTLADTVKTGNRLLQGSCVYSSKQVTSAAAIGYMSTLSTIPDPINPANTMFVNFTNTYQLSKNTWLSAMQDLGFTKLGLCRLAVGGGITWRLKRAPVNLRMSMRYNRYQIFTVGWKQLCSGSVDVAYSFKLKKHQTKQG